MGSSATYGVTWPVALRLGRVSNLPTVWTNVLAGMVLSGAAFSLGAALALMLALVAVLCRRNVSERCLRRRLRSSSSALPPHPLGEVTASTVFGMGAGLLCCGLGLLLAFGYATPGGTGLRGVGAGLALSAAILIYDVWHKNNPIGPVVMGLCRVLVYVTAAAAVAGVLPNDLLWAAGMALSYLIGLTYAAKQEDLKQPGHLWPLVFLAAPFVYGIPVAAAGGIGLAIYIIFLAAVLYALSFMMRPGRMNIPRVVALLIAGISLLDGLFMAGQGQAMLAGLTVPAFALTLLFQRYIAGT